MILSLCIFILCGIFFISPPLQIVRSFIQILSCLFIIWNNCFWSKICYPMKLIYYVENIKSTNLALGTNTKSTNLWIHELVIFLTKQRKLSTFTVFVTSSIFINLPIHITWTNITFILKPAESKTEGIEY
jgi:hypothetical protein